jgi:hypothetical protein
MLLGILLSTVSCSQQPPEPYPSLREVLALGTILEYAITPDERFAAVVVPEEAVYPGSDDYFSVSRQGPNRSQLLVFDLLSQEIVYSGEPQRSSIVSLHWIDNRIVYLDRGQDVLVTLDVETGQKELADFPHSWLDISASGDALVAWNAAGSSASPNQLTFYSFPGLITQDTVDVGHIETLENARWSDNADWMALNTHGGMYRLDLHKREVEPLNGVPNPSGGWDISSVSDLVAVDSVEGERLEIHDFAHGCRKLDLDLNIRRSYLSRPEWVSEDVLYFVNEDAKNRQHILTRIDLNELRNDGLLEC